MNMVSVGLGESRKSSSMVDLNLWQEQARYGREEERYSGCKPH